MPKGHIEGPEWYLGRANWAGKSKRSGGGGGGSYTFTPLTLVDPLEVVDGHVPSRPDGVAQAKRRQVHLQ